jgi:hypothetical protein
MSELFRTRSYAERAGVEHGVAFHSRVVGVKGMKDQVTVKVNLAVDVI